MKKLNKTVLLLTSLVLLACGEKKHTHSFGEWEVVTPATHTTVGEETRSCPCGESETREIPMSTEHSYEETSRTEASYLKDGSIVYTCACGDSYTKIIPSFQSTIEDMSITYFDAETLLAEVTVTLDDESTLVFEDLITAEDENDPDLHKIVFNVSNLSVIKSVSGFMLKDAKDFLNDIVADCTVEYHIHSYSNGVCRCEEESFRFVIDDIHTITGRGVVLSGTVQGKAIAVGDKIQKYDVATHSFVEYTISDIESSRKPLEVAQPGQTIGVCFEDAPAASEFSRGMLLVTEEGNWTPTTTVSGIIHLPYRRNPMFDSYSPNFYMYGIEVKGTITLPSEVEALLPGEMATVTVTFVNPVLVADRFEFVVREGGRTVGFFVTDYEEDELGTFVPAITVKCPTTPGGAASTKTISEGHYVDESGNEFKDLALLEPTEVDHYRFYIGITGASLIAGRGTVVTSTLAPYDSFDIEWELNVVAEELVGLECTLLVYDAEQSKTVEVESVITGAMLRSEGEYEFLLRGVNIADAENAIAMYVL